MLDVYKRQYLPYPRFLLKMEISQTAKLLYSLLLDLSLIHIYNILKGDCKPCLRRLYN